MKILKNKSLLFVLLIIVLLVFGLTLALIAYIPNITEVRVEVNDNIRVEEFSIEDAVILFKHRDGSVRTLKVTKDMLSNEDLDKLSIPGKHTITINYAKRKSAVVNINLLMDTERNVVLDKIVQGMQKTAVHNNINGELELSAYYQKEGEDRKDYTLSLKFTLDIDKEEGAENYLGLEITEDSNVLLGVYYKDNKEIRPNIYLKSEGPFTQWIDRTQNKFKSVSADEFFGEAKEVEEENLWTFDSIMDTVMSLVGDENTETMVKLVLGMLLTDPAVANDGTAATINIDLNAILEWLPLATLIPGVSGTANNFLNSINAGFTIQEALGGGIAKPPLIRIKSLFNNNGALKSLQLTDKDNNSLINNTLKLNIDGKIDAGLNIKKLSLNADNSSFYLPTDKGIEEWEESDVSFERWVLIQFHGTRQPTRPQSLEGIEEYLDIDYIGDNNPYHKLDVYRPEERSGQKLPVIINIHGGGWVYGNKEGVARYCQHLALQGFAVVNINYHLLPEEVLPEPIQDIFAVFNFVMDDENAQMYGLDTQNVFLTGDSAGGHYAMLSLSVLLDPELSELYGVQSDIQFNAVGVNSTGFSFTEILKLPIPFAHFYVNQFFSDELPYTAYRDDPRYIDMAKSLNLENNKIERFPPMFVSSSYGDIFSSHSDTLVKELEKRGVEYVYDFRKSGDKDNPENFFLGHDFNVAAPDWHISRIVNNAMCEFFLMRLNDND